MAEEKLLTIREVSQILGITEKEVIDLAESGKIPAYKIGGLYLRFKREQVEAARKNLKQASIKLSAPEKSPFRERVGDFFYFNDFYILSALIITALVLIILRGY